MNKQVLRILEICTAHHMATLLSIGANVTCFLVICQTWRRKHAPQLRVIVHPYFFFASLGTDVILLRLLQVKDRDLVQGRSIALNLCTAGWNPSISVSNF